jgi:hypothetical protein
MVLLLNAYLRHDELLDVHPTAICTYEAHSTGSPLSRYSFCNQYFQLSKLRRLRYCAGPQFLSFDLVLGLSSVLDAFSSEMHDMAVHVFTRSSL